MTTKSKSTTSQIDPVAMGRGIVRVADNVTMLVYKLVARRYLDAAELKRRMKGMALEKDMAEWSASAIA